MLAVFTIAKTNLLRKKGLTALITIIILLSSLIFSAALGMLQIMDKPFENMFQTANASHTLLYYDKKLNPPKDIAGFWRSIATVESVNVLHAHYMKGSPYYKGNKINSGLIVTEMPSSPVIQDKLVAVEGSNHQSPGENEVWLPTSFAISNNIQVGETLELPTLSGEKSFQVTAIVIDPHYSNGMTNPLRVWFQEGAIEKHFNKDNQVTNLGIRYKTFSKQKEAAAWKQFEQFLGGTFVGLKYEYEMISFSYVFLYKVIGVILIVFSLVIMGVGLTIISFTISSSILSDYSTIGIFKAQGFRSRDISFIYILQFLLLAAAAIPIGSVLSIPVIKLLIVNMSKSLGMVEVSSSGFISGIITFATLGLFIFFTAYLSSRKAANIKPAQAIRYGAPEKSYRGKQISLISLSKLPLSLMLGIKDIWAEKRQFLFMIMAAVLTSLVFALSVTFMSSLNDIFGSTKFVGLDSSELSVTNSGRDQNLSNEEVLAQLCKQPEIQYVTPMQYLVNNSVYNPDLGTSQNVIGTAYDGDMDAIGLANMEGRNPVDSNEIAISYGLSKKLHKQAGDKLEMNLEGKNVKLFISGVFQTMNSGGDGFRVPLSQIQKSNLSFELTFQVKLKPGIQPDTYENTLKERFNHNIEVTNVISMLKTQFKPIVSSIQSSILFILVVVILVCFITIFNTITIHILQMKKKYGIYKSFGMSSLDIRKMLLSKVSIASFVGTLIGTAAGIYATSFILSTIFGSIGIAQMGIVIDWGTLVLVLPLCMSIMALSTWIPSGRVLKVHPRNLIVE